MPISRVRSVTLIVMMFMMPIPPTMSEMEPTTARKARIPPVSCRIGFQRFEIVLNGELSFAISAAIFESGSAPLAEPLQRAPRRAPECRVLIGLVAVEAPQ